MKKLFPILRLLRLDKPVGTVLLLWPCWWALCITMMHRFDLWIAFIFTSGVFVMRAAGCVANDLADRNVDGHVARTRERVLVTGAVSVKHAMAILVFLLLLALLLVLQLNQQTLLWAFVGLLLALCYPLMKRVFPAPQLVLGVAFSWSIPMVYAATETPFDKVCVLLFFASILWPVIYDTFYALVDKADDLKIGIYSTAILFGRYYRLILLFLQIIFALFWLLVLPLVLTVSHYYYGVMLGVLFIMVYQIVLILPNKPALAFQAFRVSQIQGALICLALFLGLNYS